MTASSQSRPAGLSEVWAARAWNVFNEGRPFSLVYPVLVLLAAWPIGLAPEGPIGLALLGALVLAAVMACFQFPLRGRVLLWLAAAASVPLLEPWRAPALLLGALAGYVFFTVFFWGTLYYRLRTGAPWTNFTRFWRLVATNSDPTSGNALEQIPKFTLALSAGTLLAESPNGGSITGVAASALLLAGFGELARKRFAARHLPDYPAQAGGAPAPSAKRVYVLVIDGANQQRLWQANTPHIDRLTTEGTEYLNVEPAYPAAPSSASPRCSPAPPPPSTACAPTSPPVSASEWNRSSTRSSARARRAAWSASRTCSTPSGTGSSARSPRCSRRSASTIR